MNDIVQYRLVIADDHPLFRGALREAVAGLLEPVDIAEAGTFDDVVALLDRGGDIDLGAARSGDAGRARLFRPDLYPRAISRACR